MRVAAGRFGRTGVRPDSRRLVAIAGMIGLAGLLAPTVPAQAGDLVVSPKNELTVMRDADGNVSPGKLRYKLTVSTGKKTRWRIMWAPSWLVADPESGIARPKKSVVTFLAKKKKIRRKAPGIYEARIAFRYKDGGEAKVVRRNVALIAEGSPAAGAAVFNAKCIGCHDLDYNKNGPLLRGVYGRTAGTAPGFSHSDALKDYGKIWEERNLNDWLTNPQKLVKGADMYLSLKDGEDRMNVISFLKANSM